jgi:PIN like domain
LVVDPERAFGQPLVVHGGARVEDLVDRFRAGDGVADITATSVSLRARLRTSSGLPPASLPEFSSIAASDGMSSPKRYAASAPPVHTMADVYGERIGQGLADEEWLQEAGQRDWIVLMKDARIRRRRCRPSGGAFRRRSLHRPCRVLDARAGVAGAGERAA